jgi:nitroreductase
MVDTGWWRADGTPDDTLRACLLAAAAAPSVHNTQPWRFRPHDAGVDVLVDRGRQLRTQDPHGREMYVSVGAAVLNLRLALASRGLRPDVGLMPDPADPDLAARVLVTSEETAPPAERSLAGAIHLRHTNRRPFADVPVPEEVLREMSGAAGAEAATMLVVDPPLRDGVLSLTRTAEKRMLSDPAYLAELSRWTTPPGIGRRDGVPREAFGPRDVDAAIPMREFALANRAPTAVVEFEPEPTIVLLFTYGDTPAHWLRAGAALQRLLLVATLRGLAATPLSQVTEVPALRELLAESATGRVVQTVLRIGYPLSPAASTPRRPLEDLLVRPEQPSPTG